MQPYTVTVAERIVSVRTFMTDAREGDQPRIQLSFAGLLGESSSRLEIIVTFLAVLEMIKQRELLAQQDDTFGEIVLVLVDQAENGNAEEEDTEMANEVAEASSAATEPEE